jgi:hypothetical protein
MNNNFGNGIKSPAATKSLNDMNIPAYAAQDASLGLHKQRNLSTLQGRQMIKPQASRLRPFPFCCMPAVSCFMFSVSPLRLPA